MIRSILVARNILKPFRKPTLPRTEGCDRGGSLSGFFVFSDWNIKRGYNPALDDVDATESDKRTEPSLYLLRKLGVVKTGRGVKAPKLDKREHLSCG
jgi:hypothetical protein